MDSHGRSTGERNEATRRRLLMVLLTYSPAVVVTLIFFISPRPLTHARFAAMAFVLGLVGVIIMVRKESPTTLGSVRGKWAVAQGALITLAFWLAALYLTMSGS